MASIATQKTLIKRETVPGTANVTAMMLLSAMKLRPGWSGEAETFMGGSSKVATTIELPDEMGEWTVEGTQDFNHLGLVLASRLGLPTTTTPSGGVLSRDHRFALNPDEADTGAFYTVQYGDASQAVQAVYAVFNSLGLTIQRGNLDFSSSMISREPQTGATLASSGLVTMASAPIPRTKYNIWADDTWAGRGITKLLAAYELGLTLGDKYVADAPINSAVVSYESLVEAENQEAAFTMTLGFNATAIGLISTFKAGALKFIRIQCLGPIIEGAIPYTLTIDFPVFIIGRGALAAAPNSPTVTLPLRCVLAKDPTSGNSLNVVLINTVTAY